MRYDYILNRRVTVMWVLTLLGLALVSGCATSQVWPDHERDAANRLDQVQQKIGEGLKTALTPDQAQIFLADLKGIRAEYTELRDKRVYRSDWENLLEKIDALDQDVTRAMRRTTTIERPADTERLIALQRKIDDAKISGRLTVTEARDFQVRLDSIRSDYLRMTEKSRSVTTSEAADISRRLDSLETDLIRYR